jgi:D-beta-D-heptose 7-phosphate kinase/D-beta-D-heptose 1-phosphate adenosyltransferase
MNTLTTIPQQSSFKVLLIGDSCTDTYSIGTVDRLSPEAPVPVLKIIETYNVQGMAANVHLNLKNLGIEADFITNAEQITKQRFIDRRSGQHLLRVDDDVKVSQWARNLPLPLHEYDAIVISDYDKGFLTYESIRYLIEMSTGYVFIDTKKKDLAFFGVCDKAYIKINDLESKLATSSPTNLIVTRGGDGAEYNGKIFPTNKVEVTDVCGCGDTFLSALAVQFLFTKDIEKAIIFANIAAGITVQHRGNYAPSYDEIRHAGY